MRAYKIVVAVGFLVLITLQSSEGFAEQVLSGNDKKIETLRTSPSGSKKLGRYEGRFPCDDCNATKVSLLLNIKLADGKPSTFLLERINVGNGNDRTVCSGVWQIDEKKSDKDSKRIFLTGDCPDQFVNYLVISSKVAILLDSSGYPRVGNAQLNFTLSRID